MAAEPDKTCLWEQALTAGNFKSLFRMYAIVDIAGQQFKVEAGSKIFVNRLTAKADESVEFNKVLLIDNEGAVKVGAPYVEGAVVKATVLRDDIKAKKVLLVADDAAVKVGAPYVEGAVVKATVLDDEVKADKVIVFKKIRRKGFQKLNGHRQKLTKIKINEIA